MGSMDYTKTEMEEGVQIAEEFFRVFSAENTEQMDIDGDNFEEQLKALRECYEGFRPKLEGNAWCRSILNEL